MLDGTHHSGRMACGPTKLTGTEGFVNLVNMNDSSSSDRCPSNSRSASSTSGLLAPAAQTSARSVACPCLPWPDVMPRRPHRPLLLPPLAQGIPLLTHTPCYSATTVASRRSRTSEPSYSSTRGHPVPRLPRLRVIPFLGLAVVHRPGSLGAASTWSTNDFHR